MRRYVMELRLTYIFIFICGLAQIIVCFQEPSSDTHSEDISHYKEEGWSGWSEWSTCTRTCGGGMAVQSRRCLHIQGCRGSSVRYNVCSLDACPDGVPDFYTQQCSEYNTVHFNGELHDWEPAPQEDQLCALNCRATGMNSPPVTLNSKVLDGTRCGKNSEGMCVHGQCQSIGCDMVLGSRKEKDSCGVCGGDNSSCQKTQWVKRGLGPCSATCGGGYRVVTVVCKDINSGEEVPEEKCSHTHKPAQVIVTCGETPCPASWEVGEWQQCSATCGFGYQLREVSCREQRNNSSIRVADHECQEQRPVHRKTCGGAECPRWFEGIWSECSVTCGEGVQRRAVQCRLSDGKSSNTCDLNHRPDSTRPCRTGVRCLSAVLAHPQHLPLANSWQSEAEETANFLPSEAPLSLDEQVPAEPTFIASSWSSCSETCGEGVRTREVTCKIFLEFSRTVAILPDSQCPGSRPVEAKRCFVRSCDSIMMSEPSKDPNEEISRHFTSLESLEPSSLPRDEEKSPSSHGEIPSKLQSLEDDVGIPNDYEVFRYPSPDSEEVPPRIVPLDSKKKNGVSTVYKEDTYDIFHYKKRYMWKSAGFTSCSASCLGGVQESISYCVRADDEKRVSSSLCDIKERPDSVTRTCNDDPCPPQWEEMPFDPCSKPCGGGITRRQVRCVQQVTSSSTTKIVVPNSECLDPPPYAQKFCNMMPCSPTWVRRKWSECSVACGSGIKTRSVQCMQTSSFGTSIELPFDRCSTKRPPSRRGCRSFNCGGGIPHPHRRRRKGPVIKAQAMQNYEQKKFMKAVNLKIGGQASVFHGAKIKVKCPVRRFDRRFLTWWRNGERLGTSEDRWKNRRIRVTEKGVLKINRIQYTDAAVYICKADDQEANLTLRVEPLPASFATSEEAEEVPPDQETTKTLNNIDRNEVFSNSLHERKDRDGLTAPAGSAFAKAGFKLASEVEGRKKLENPPEDSLMETSGPFRATGTNIHTMEESSVEDAHRSKLLNRPYIFGTVARHGNRAHVRAPTSGISFLSGKVAQSKKSEGITAKDLFSSLPQRRKEKNVTDTLDHIYGTLLNTTKHEKLLSNTKRVYFGTLLHEHPSKKPMSHFQDDPEGDEFYFQNENRLRDHKERSTEISFADENSDSMVDLFSDAASDGDFSSPQFLGKGNKDSLHFEWKVTNWTECSQSCSFPGTSGGYQVRSTQCVVRVNNVSQAVDAALCEDAGLRAPPTIQQCGAEECPQWRVNDWSDCENSRCFTHHYAFQKRDVMCILHNGTDVPASFCDAVTKPRHRRECYNRQCIGVWRTGEWSKCTAPCEGQGYRTRLLQCVWNGTKKSAGNACREQPRPEVVRWCDGPPCEKEQTKKETPGAHCQDMSRYCKIVQRINMCRVKLYRQKCCLSCQ